MGQRIAASHAIIDHPTSELDDITLAKFFEATRSYRRFDHSFDQQGKEITSNLAFQRRLKSRDWAQWVHNNMNLNYSSPFRSTLALRLDLRRFQTRIGTAVLVPLLVSSAVGGWYTWMYNDAGVAWTIAGYIVSVGACK